MPVNATQANIDATISQLKAQGKSGPSIAAYLSSLGIQPPQYLLTERQKVTPRLQAEPPTGNGFEQIKSSLGGIGNFLFDLGTGAADLAGKVHQGAQGLLEKTGIPQAVGTVASAAAKGLGAGVGTVAGAIASPISRAAKGLPVTAKGIVSDAVQAGAKTMELGEEIGYQGGAATPLAIIEGRYGGGAFNTLMGANMTYGAWKDWNSGDPNRQITAPLRGALGAVGAYNAAKSPTFLPNIKQLGGDLGAMTNKMASIYPDLQQRLHAKIFGQQAVTAANKPPSEPIAVQSPYTNKVVKAPSTAGYEDFLNAEKSNAKDITSPTATQAVANKIEQSFEVVKVLKQSLGEAKGEYMAKVADTPMQGVDGARSWLLNKYAEFGWTIDDDGALAPLPGSKPVALGAGGKALWQNTWNEVAQLGDEATLGSVDTTVDNLQSLVKFSGTSSQNEAINSVAQGVVKQFARGLNNEVYKVTDANYLALNEQYGEVAKAYDDLNTAIKADGKGTDAFVQSAYARNNTNTLRILDSIHKLTGYDALKDVLFAKAASDTFAGRATGNSLLENVSKISKGAGMVKDFLTNNSLVKGFKEAIGSKAFKAQPAGTPQQPLDVGQTMGRGPGAAQMPARKVVTDPAQVQEIKNSIDEGEYYLRTGKDSVGGKIPAERIQSIQRAVDNAKAKIGLSSSEVDGFNPKDYAMNTKFATLNQATKKIPKLGGYAHIEDMPLEQRNAYGAEQLGSTLKLNPEVLYKDAMMLGHDLSKTLSIFDGMDNRTEAIQWVLGVLKK